MPFCTLVLKVTTTGFTILATYWRAFSNLPSASTKSVLWCYPIAPHPMIPRNGEVYASIIASSCDLSAVGVDLTATYRSETLLWTPQDATQCPDESGSTPCKSLCRWHGINDKQRMVTPALNPASRYLFPRVSGDSLPVTAAGRISAAVNCLFGRATWIILGSSRGVVLLEGPAPALLATLLSWVHLVTTRSAFNALHPIVCSISLYDAPIPLMPMIRPFRKSERWREAAYARLPCVLCCYH